MQRAQSSSSFDRLGPAVPAHPVILSVPHGGRAYPQALLDNLRVPAGQLQALEDRCIDAVAQVARGDCVTLIARRPRAWIDLNRAETDRDPGIELGLSRHAVANASAKVRAGLGLVPRRVGTSGDLWASRWPLGEIDARIRNDHRPYHHALADAIDAAQRRFGIAILLDLHSMPPLTGEAPARIVIGDRFGKTAHPRFVAAIEREVRGHGHRLALNAPYAGGHILDRHAAPKAGIHAIQLELDRSLYLDAALDQPGSGLAATVDLVRAVIAALADEACPRAIAAE